MFSFTCGILEVILLEEGLGKVATREWGGQEGGEDRERLVRQVVITGRAKYCLIEINFKRSFVF
jgi:hypothetical protein